MAMKGIKITESNQQMLMARYNIPHDDLEMFPIGYIMITDFGDNGEERYEGVLTQARFDQSFAEGEALSNGFFAINRK
jgi:hypothetical protein